MKIDFEKALWAIFCALIGISLVGFGIWVIIKLLQHFNVI